MPENTLRLIDDTRRDVLIRVGTLVRLRWLAILGQTLAIIITYLGLGFDLPWSTCLLLVVLSALLNLVMAKRYASNQPLPSQGVLAILTFDTMQLGVLLYLTGGLQNPFSVLLLAPVIVSATSLRMSYTLILGSITVATATLLMFFHEPLPWFAGPGSLSLPLVYRVGIWTAIICTLGFMTIYTFRVAEEARKLADALAATELVLQREQHISTLDGLAAAAAHELGTPLATIALVSKEMVHTLPDDSALLDDARLLREQAQRCREILQKLTTLGGEQGDFLESQTLSELIEEVVEPIRLPGTTINVVRKGGAAEEPVLSRNPGLLYGLSNLVDNALDFATSAVTLTHQWDSDKYSILIEDDGWGYSPEVLARIGEPFISTRSHSDNAREHGLGLGIFIAKTLLERGGAVLKFGNSHDSSGKPSGARVEIVWPRSSN